MSKEIFTLTETDRQVLRDLIKTVRQRRLTAPIRTQTPSNTDQTPEVYVIEAPTPGGIPAAVGDVPGSANCFLYEQIEGTLYLLSSDVEVFNISLREVAAGTKKIAVRDKWGTWYVDSDSTGVSTVEVVTDICLTISQVAIPTFDAAQEDPTELSVLVGNGSAFVSRPMTNVLDDLGGITGTWEV